MLARDDGLFVGHVSRFAPYPHADDLEPVAHARQETIELIVTQLDLAGEELADAWLMDSADPGQLGLGDAGFKHHVT